MDLTSDHTELVSACWEATLPLQTTVEQTRMRQLDGLRTALVLVQRFFRMTAHKFRVN